MRWIRNAISLLGLTLLASHAFAQSNPATPHADPARLAGVQQLLAPVPPGVRGIVVLRDPVSLRARLLSSEPAMALARLGVLGPFDRPWKALALAMDRTSEQLVNDLIGGGVAMIATDLTADPDTGARDTRAVWSALSLVTEQTAGLMRERLRAIPAMLVQGQPVYAIEDGELWLLIRPLAAPIGDRSHVLVITSPDGGEARIEPIARLLAQQQGAPPDQIAPGPWSLVDELVDHTGVDAPNSTRLPTADISLIWRVELPEPAWVAGAASIAPDRWQFAATTAALSVTPPPLSDPGLIDRLIAAQPQLSMVVHVNAGFTIADVVAPGESLTCMSGAPGSKPVVTHAARAPSLQHAAEMLDSRAAALRSLLSADPGSGTVLSSLLPQLEATTWRQMPLPLRSGSPLRAIFGPNPIMAWRAVPVAEGAWTLWLMDPGPSDPDESIASALAVTGGDADRAYIARLRLKPRAVRDAMPPLFTIPLHELGVLHVINADAWAEPAPGSASRRLRMRGEIRFGKP